MNPIPNDIGWSTFLLGWSLGDRTKFAKTMEGCSEFKSIDGMHKEADTVMLKATKTDLKRLYPDPAKDAMSVDIPR